MSVGCRQVVGVFSGKTVFRAPFSTMSQGTILVPATSNKKHYIVSLTITNNASNNQDDVDLVITDGTSTCFYGSVTHGIYLHGRGGRFNLIRSVIVPWFVGSINTPIRLWFSSGLIKWVAGVVEYYDE